jgi:hypothetical protein
MNVTSSSEYGASGYNTTGYYIGGGEGYNDILTGGSDVVTSKAELLTALLTATSGDIIYVTEGTTIDMTGTPPTGIPAGVTLASNRGSAGSLGALIKKTASTTGYAGNSSTTRWTSSTWEETMFYAMGDDVRVTGLRLEGEMKPQDDESVTEDHYLVGIFARSKDNLTIDNNEIRGWSWAGVQTAWCTDVTVNNNYIHSNQARGEGYGSSQYGGEVVYDRNLYDLNRHSITSSGLAGEQYIARYNIVKANGDAIGSVHFDVHEDEDFGGRAGDYFYIHHNTFMDGNGTSDPDVKMNSVHIRHKADTGMYISNNLFQTISTEITDKPIYQSYHTDEGLSGGFENLFATNNQWMTTIYPNNTGITYLDVHAP